MAKHLAKTEKKKRPEKPVREIRIPEINLRKRASAPPETERKDPFQSAMLNKTLDRRFTPSDLFLTLLAVILLVAAYFLPTSGPVRLLSFMVPFLLAGWNYLYEAFQEAFMGIVLGRELIVTVAGLMALCAGAWFGAAAIMICLKIADLALAYVESRQNEKVAGTPSARSALPGSRPDPRSKCRQGRSYRRTASFLKAPPYLTRRLSWARASASRSPRAARRSRAARISTRPFGSGWIKRKAIPSIRSLSAPPRIPGCIKARMSACSSAFCPI